jgi:predicted Zn-dependent protease
MSEPTRRQQLEAMLADDPTDEFLRYGLAMEFISAGDHETAVRFLRELIALNPAKPYVPAYLIAGQSLLKLGRANDAIAVLRDGVAAAQKQGNLHAAGEMQALLDSVE